MSKQTQVLIGIGAGILMLAGVFTWFVYMPKLRQVKSLRITLQNERDRLAEAQQKAKEEDTLDRRSADVRRALDYVYRRLPAKGNIRDVIDEVSRATGRAGISYTSFVPQKASSTGGVADTPILVTIQGTYHGFGTFLTELSAQPRVFTVSDVALNSDFSTGNTMGASIVIHAYHMDSGS